MLCGQIPERLDQRIGQLALEDTQTHRERRHIVVNLKYTDGVLQRTIVHHQLRHEPNTEAQAHHAYDRFIPRYLRVDVRFYFQLSKPGIGALPSQPALGQYHRHLLPSDVAITYQFLVEIIALDRSDEDERRDGQRLHGQCRRYLRRNGGNTDVFLILQDPVERLRGIAGVDLELDAWMTLAKAAQ